MDRTSPSPSALTGGWVGAIELPGGGLDVRIELSLGESGWAGAIDIPIQGLRGAPFEEVRVGEGELAFAVRGLPGDPTFRGTLAGGRIRGAFTQAGQSFPFSLVRGSAEDLAGPPRPQEPEPPFPYHVEEVTYRSSSLTLAGTLTLPAAPGPHPAALLLSGSGAHNRDEEVFGHKPFLVLADHLTRKGIAVLRVDDRGVGDSSGNAREATTADLAEDALKGVSYLAARLEVASGKVGLVGHSEGAMVASLAAARSPDVAFTVLLAGPGVPGRDVLARQNELILRSRGIPENVIRFHGTVLAALIDASAKGMEEEALAAELREVADAAKTELPEAERKLAEAVLENLDKQLPRMTTPWFRYFLSHDPRDALRQARAPGLAVAGELDLQVPPEQSFPEIEKALAASRAEDVTLRRLAGLNHLFQPAETGSPLEYAAIEQTIHPDVLELVGVWIADRYVSTPGE